MSFPSPAQRRDWYTTNRETPEVKGTGANAAHVLLDRISKLDPKSMDLVLCFLAGYRPEAVERALDRVGSL